MRRPPTSYDRVLGRHVDHGVLAEVAVEQPTRVRRTLVVVAHHPDQLGTELLGHRLDQLAQPGVGLGLGLVGEVAGEHQGVGRRLHPEDPVEQGAQAVLGHDGVVLETPRA